LLIETAVEECVYCGTIAKTHGVKGEVLLKANIELPKETEFVFIEMDGIRIPFFISPNGLRLRNRTKHEVHLLVLFDDVDNEATATGLVGCDVYTTVVEEEEATEQPYSTLADFEGFTVKNANQEEIGICLEVLDIPNNPLLKVMSQGQEVLIPFHEDLLIEVDPTSNCLVVEIPEGLIEIFREESENSPS